MTTEHDYTDETLLETLKETGAPRILTMRTDGTAVYVALSPSGNSLTEVNPEDG